MSQAKPAATPVQAVVFRLGAFEFGLPVSNVHEVLPYREPATAAGPAGRVAGTLDVRGALLPVLDLRQRFGVEGDADAANRRILVVELEGERLGFSVDAATEVLRISPDQLADPPEDDELAADAVAGHVLAGPDRRIRLLRTDRLLTPEQRDALLGALPPARGTAGRG